MAIRPCKGREPLPAKRGNLHHIICYAQTTVREAPGTFTAATKLWGGGGGGGGGGWASAPGAPPMPLSNLDCLMSRIGIEGDEV